MVPKGNRVFKSRDIQTNSLELYKKKNTGTCVRQILYLWSLSPWEFETQFAVVQNAQLEMPLIVFLKFYLTLQK